MRAPRWLAVLATWLVLALAASAEEAPRHAVLLEIRDELTGSGLAATIRRDVGAGTGALEFMESVVAVEYRRYPGVGVFVTSLCGVPAPKGTFWALAIDGETATEGISGLTVDRAVHIRWDLVKADAPERPKETRPLRGRPESSLREFSKWKAPLSAANQAEHLFHDSAP